MVSIHYRLILNATRKLSYNKNWININVPYFSVLFSLQIFPTPPSHVPRPFRVRIITRTDDNQQRNAIQLETNTKILANESRHTTGIRHDDNANNENLGSFCNHQQIQIYCI